VRLDEKAWILSGGDTPEWKAVSAHRAEQALAQLGVIARAFKSSAPKAVKADGLNGALEAFLKRRGPVREKLLSHPALDYWLFLWDKHFSHPSDEMNWRLQFGLFAGFPLSLALLEGDKKTLALTATLDPEAHLHLYGVPAALRFPAELALKTARLALKAGLLSVECEGKRWKVPAKALLGEEEYSSAGLAVARSPEVIPGLSVEHCGLLFTQCVVMHGLAHPSPAETTRFVEVLRTALRHIEERDPKLFFEMTQMTTTLIPLVNTIKFGSVSSSYVNMRGAICLSHAEDPLLQAETLIHEFCHQKMNQLLLVDELLLPGQAGQVFYSPWRKDARRLRGLILGAHAFLNVAAYLIKSLSREEYELKERVSVMVNVARRLFEVEAAVAAASSYGEYTEFGRRFILGMSRELQKLFHAVQWFPAELVAEARAAAAAHRAEHALPLTGIHRSEGFVTAVKAPRYEPLKEPS
jgi:HEXXH motif-containing protein